MCVLKGGRYDPIIMFGTCKVDQCCCALLFHNYRFRMIATHRIYILAVTVLVVQEGLGERINIIKPRNRSR